MSYQEHHDGYGRLLIALIMLLIWHFRLETALEAYVYAFRRLGGGPARRPVHVRQTRKKESYTIFVLTWGSRLWVMIMVMITMVIGHRLWVR